MYEHHAQPLLPKDAFLKRLANHGGLAALVLLVSLTVGTAGYHRLAHLGWIDALLNASMILGGMGPVDILTTRSAKLFAAGYALYSGFILLASAGLLFAPVLHRIFHKLHLDAE